MAVQRLVFVHRDRPLPLDRRDAELLRDHLPLDSRLSVDIETCLVAAFPEDGSGVLGPGPILYSFDYDDLIVAIGSIRRSSGAAVSDSLAALEAQIGPT